MGTAFTTEDMDLDQARGFATDLGSRGDVLMDGGKKSEAADLFNRLAHALAVLAFAPGGVKVFGHYWKADPPPRRRIRIIKANKPPYLESRSPPRECAPAGDVALEPPCRARSSVCYGALAR
jgi:hypothetical protein